MFNHRRQSPMPEKNRNQQNGRIPLDLFQADKPSMNGYQSRKSLATVRLQKFLAETSRQTALRSAILPPNELHCSVIINAPWSESLKDCILLTRIHHSMKANSSITFVILGSLGFSSLRAEELHYETPVTLKGMVTVLYDMSFVDSDMSPVKDLKGTKVKFPDPEKADLQKPVRHLILKLEQPISVAAGENDGLHPEVKNITEIDLGGSALSADKIQITDGSSVSVTGKLWHANTVHHLREIMMNVSSIIPTKKADQGAAAKP